MLKQTIPFIFVVLWASGFVGAKIGLVYAEPATLLTIRMLGNIVLFSVLIILLRRSIPKGKALLHSCVVGMLIHGFYLGGTYEAIKYGMPAGLSALLVGIQPLLTAIVVTSFAKQVLKPSQWLGLVIGFIGIGCVLVGNIHWQEGSEKLAAFIFVFAALLGITFGTLYQKRFCQGADMIGGAMTQYVAAAMLFIPVAVMTETREVNWTWAFSLTMLWLVVVLSGVAVLLLLYMVKHGESSKVASVFYLVPPVAAVQAWLLFGEYFDQFGMLGFALASASVYLVAKAPRLKLSRFHPEKLIQKKYKNVDKGMSKQYEIR
ncbi:DMT family transporter [Vibrio cionasavignyae]|uniref:DMT family transporter n=1 Tax=Vibrio cionasavignyae TaxID=2910252 RepID=UPI003D0C1B91